MARIVAFKNGDYHSGGIVINLPDTLPELFVKAGEVLKVEGEVKRVFMANGGEVVDVKTIRDGDKLFFSAGEPFIMASFFSQKQLLHQLAAQMVTLYGSSSVYVKKTAPPIVSNSITTAENTAKSLAATPLGTRAIEASNMALVWADDRLDAAMERLHRASSSFLNSEVAKTVNASLVLPIKQRSEAFYANAMEIYLSLDVDKDGKVSLADFTSALKAKLGASYNDNLVEPTKKFYAIAQQEVSNLVKKADEKTNATAVYESVKNKLGASWKESVAANFLQVRVQAPAEAFYRAAMESYAALDVDGDGKVSFQDFVAGIKVKLGAWNEKLGEPAQHLFRLLRTAAPKDSAAPALVAGTGPASS